MQEHDERTWHDMFINAAWMPNSKTKKIPENELEMNQTHQNAKQTKKHNITWNDIDN